MTQKVVRNVFLKEPSQRVEERKSRAVDTVGLREQRQMENQSRAVFSIGTFNIFPPKPDTEIGSFTFALCRPVAKNELYAKLAAAFAEDWDGEPTKSVYVRLVKPLPLKVLRERLRAVFGDAFVQ